MCLEGQILKTLVMVSVFLLPLSCVCKGCNPAEYKIGPECCPMCKPGSHVYKHCTEQTSTSCVPCTGSAFTDKPNGVTKCGPCTLCDHGLGLKTVKECKPFSDAVCGVLEGNYCTDPHEGGCRAAQKHTTCKPGHFIKHPGTDSTDTVCEICPENSYSDGFCTSCTPHTDCESKGLPTVKPGDSVSDSQCVEKNLGPVIAGIVVGIILLLTIGGVKLYKSRFCSKKNSSKQGPLQQDQIPAQIPINCSTNHIV